MPFHCGCVPTIQCFEDAEAILVPWVIGIFEAFGKLDVRYCICIRVCICIFDVELTELSLVCSCMRDNCSDRRCFDDWCECICVIKPGYFFMTLRNKTCFVSWILRMLILDLENES